MTPKEPKSWNPEVRLAVLEAEVMQQKKELAETRDDLCGDKPQSLTSRVVVLETDKTEARASFRTAVAIVSAVVAIGSGAVMSEVRSLRDDLRPVSHASPKAHP